MNYRTCKALAVGFTLLSLGGVAGCTDPTVSPSSTIANNNAFADPRSYRAFLAKLYAGLSTTGQQGPAGNKDIQSISDEGFSQYVRLYWNHQELPSDEAVLAWGDAPVQDFNTQQWGETNNFVSGMFARIYVQVTLANEFLRQTTDAKLTERAVTAPIRTDVQIFRAEARFLRALSYWHGIDLFGPIPLVTEADPAYAGPPPQQATRQAVYDFIVSDLLLAKDSLVSAAGPSTYGRATKEAAAMLLAEVYLNAEVYTGTPKYAEAQAAAAEVIAGPFTLDARYRHLFERDNNTSPEMIFPVIQDGEHIKSYGGTTFLIHASCGGSPSDAWYLDPAAYGVEGCWWGLRLKPEAYNLSATDPRATYFVTAGRTAAIASLTSFSDGIAAPKFTNLDSAGVVGFDPAFPDTDFPMFRLGEAYLIYAEAEIRNGGATGVGLGYVNALRQRAYGDNSGDITLGQLDLDFILDERSRELLWEAHRRTDLIRFGKFSGSTYIWSWKGGTQAGAGTPSYLDLYPIPATQLSANPNLVQNPGY